jgi:hypothetical protein
MSFPAVAIHGAMTRDFETERQVEDQVTLRNAAQRSDQENTKDNRCRGAVGRRAVDSASPTGLRQPAYRSRDYKEGPLPNVICLLKLFRSTNLAKTRLPPSLLFYILISSHQRFLRHGQPD